MNRKLNIYMYWEGFLFLILILQHKSTKHLKLLQVYLCESPETLVMGRNKNVEPLLITTFTFMHYQFHYFIWKENYFFKKRGGDDSLCELLSFDQAEGFVGGQLYLQLGI